jgi:hypothetical protein
MMQDSCTIEWMDGEMCRFRTACNDAQVNCRIKSRFRSIRGVVSSTAIGY